MTSNYTRKFDKNVVIQNVHVKGYFPYRNESKLKVYIFEKLIIV